jgi:hypothetical protein
MEDDMREKYIMGLAIIAFLVIFGIQTFRVWDLQAKIADMQSNSGLVYISGVCTTDTFEIRINNASIMDPAFPHPVIFGRWFNLSMIPGNRTLTLGQGYASYGDAKDIDWIGQQALEAK